MTWQIPVLGVAGVSIIFHFLLKTVSDKASRTRRLAGQYFFAACFSLIFSFCTDTLVFAPALLLIAVYGILNSLGGYCQWRAVAISQSQPALFTQANDVIAIGLGYLILNETQYLSPMLLIGMLCCFTGGFILVINQREEMQKPIGGFRYGIFFWITCYSLIWSGVSVIMRYCGFVEDISTGTFILYWYAGSLIGALTIRHVLCRSEAGPPLNRKEIAEVALLALAIWGNLNLFYLCHRLAPITVIRPFFFIIQLVIPLFMGLYIFKEIKQMKPTGWFALVLAALGCIIIMASHS